MAELSPREKGFAASAPGLADYVASTFVTDDPVLAEVRQRADAAGLPHIHVSPFDTRMLEVIARATGARKIVEIGTLAGYSGISLARALPVGRTPSEVVLHTFEYEPKHAEVARESFERAGVSDRVVIHVGPALSNLPSIENQGPFDLVFIDADKENYPNYLSWAQQHLRVGGTVLVDNALAWGQLGLPAATRDAKRTSAIEAIHAVNSALGAPQGPWRSIMLPTGEGLAMGVKF